MGWRLGVIGAGNMAWAIVEGALASRVLAPEAVTVSRRSKEGLVRWQDRLGVTITTDNEAVIAQSDLVLMAVKPNQFDAVFTPLRSCWRPGQLAVSVAAGLTVARLQSWVGPDALAVRTMPNTPCMVRQGVTGIVDAPRLSQDPVGRARLTELFGAVGTVEFLPESQINALTGVSGSGPAYIFLVVEALRDAAIAAGLDPKMAARLATQTVYGAAALAHGADDAPEVLRAKVTSPGGTTERGVAALEAGGLRAVFVDAVLAARDHGRAMGAQ